ncbi:MAG: PP2C family protein-serine/threonine phosphatase [Nocardioidaceae bacterium]
MQCVEGDLNSSAARLFEGFLRRTHLSRPSELADVVAEEVEAALGASDVVLSLANHEQTALVPVPSRRSTPREDQKIEGTFAGRAFSTMELVTAPAAESGRRRVWLPMLDGTERMGTLELTVPSEGDTVASELVMILERYTHAVAQATLSKGLYGDVFERVRRSQPMTVGAELLWSVLPPLTYATEGLVISAMLEPAYDNGGDAFDYAVNDTHAHLAVFDAMGHGLAASGAAVLAVAAYRNTRRADHGLSETYALMDAAIGEHFPDRFVTAVLAQLELDSGRLTWVNAGHPPPLLVRRARVVKRLEAPAATPLGMLFERDDAVVGSEQLEQGDVVLIYTDGLTEARQPGGAFLTEEGLTDFLRREATAELPTPEMLRRFRRALLDRVGGVLRDDASAVLVHWRGGAEERLLPESVTSTFS